VAGAFCQPLRELLGEFYSLLQEVFRLFSFESWPEEMFDPFTRHERQLIETGVDNEQAVI